MISIDESIPTKSPEYLAAQSIFYTQFNDVSFYVEDEDQENLYFRILKKLFPGLRIDKIFPLGGKPRCIEHAKKGTSGRVSVYILDKDFDDLLGLILSKPNIFYLERYCVENFLFEEEALIKFVISEKPRLKERDIKRKLGFEELMKSISSDLQELFLLFFVVQKFTLPGLANTSQNVERFCTDNDPSHVCSKKVDEYSGRVQETFEKAYPRRKFRVALRRNKKYFNLPRGQCCPKNISGKHILSLLRHRNHYTFDLSAKPSLDSFALRLAEYCEFRSLEAIANSIATYLKRRGIRNA